YRGDHRLRRRPQPKDQTRHVGLRYEAVPRLIRSVRAGRVAIAVKVEAGAETAPCARDYDRAARAVQGEGLELHMQRLAERCAHRVQLVRPVEREQMDLRQDALAA